MQVSFKRTIYLPRAPFPVSLEKPAESEQGAGRPDAQRARQKCRVPQPSPAPATSIRFATGPTTPPSGHLRPTTPRQEPRRLPGSSGSVADSAANLGADIRAFRHQDTQLHEVECDPAVNRPANLLQHDLHPNHRLERMDERRRSPEGQLCGYPESGRGFPGLAWFAPLRYRRAGHRV
jgi:hypothetical protein